MAVVGVGEVLSFRVADTYHHSFHVADARVTYHLDGVIVVFVVNGAFLGLFRVDVVEAYVAVGLVHGLVAPLLHLNKVFQTNVQVVDFGPDGFVVGIGCSPSCHF